MGILDKVKSGIDFPRWQQTALATAHAAGVSHCSDKRNDIFAWPAIFQLASASALNVYYAPYDGWIPVANPAISAFGAGSAAVFVPSMTYKGSIGAGCSTTKIVTTTVMSTAIAQDGFVFQDNSGFLVRIIGNSAGGSGKVEERWIVQNSSGTTPTLYLISPLTFTPANGDTYEIISGKIFCLGSGATAATQVRYYQIGTGAMVSCAGTGLTIATDSSMISLDEMYVPYDRRAGEGFLVGAGTYDASHPLTAKGCLTATASAAGTLTGQASSGDAGVFANEYRNFQIRIVEDTGTPTAVNQRRIIASHTAGASPVYTLGSNWAVTPSSTAKFVIENPNLILLFTVAGSTAVYTYNPTDATINNGTTSLSANTWSSTYFGARAAAVAAGTLTFPSWGHQPTTVDGVRNSRHSYIFSFRGGGVSTIDMLDIAGGASGAWSNAITVNNQTLVLPNTGAGGDYAPIDKQGREGYFTVGATNAVYNFDVKYRSIFPFAQLPAQSGTAAVGNRVAVVPYMNQSTGADKMSMLFVQGHLSTQMFKAEVIV